VTIIPDNDEPGRKHAQEAAICLPGKVASLKILALPNLPLKGNVSDWLAARGTREQLWALTASAPEFVTSDSDNRERMQFTRLSDLLNEPDENTRWLVENFRCRAPAAESTLSGLLLW